MAVTWNPADKGANLTLSNGNLTATGATTADSLVRATTSLTALGKYFWSLTTPTLNNVRPGIGFANSTTGLAGILGTDLNSIGYQPSGTVLLNNVVATTIGTWVAGDTIDVAVDLTNSKLWYRINGGNWNNSGAANPATNVGGISTSTMNAGPYFPAVYVYSTAQAVANFGASAYTYAPPSGFINLAPTTVTATNLTTSSPTLGSPALTQVHSLTATNLTTGSPVIGSPLLSQLLFPSGLTVGSPVIGTPAFVAGRVLAQPVSSRVVTAYPVPS